MKTIGFYNNKGGVGKTTAAINFACCLAEQGRVVVVADCDRQRNAYRFFENARYTNVSAVACDGVPGIDTNADFVILDLPPALSDDVSEIVRTCDCLFIPVELSPFAVQGLSGVTEIAAAAGVPYWCFVFKFVTKNPTDRQLFDLMKSNLGDKVFDTVIPYSNAIKNSFAYNQNAFEYMGKNPAVLGLYKLFGEMLGAINRI